MIDFDRLAEQFPIRDTLRSAGITVHGNSFKCPFHDDKTASASLRIGPGDKRERWHCFKCEIGGDSIDFVQNQNPSLSRFEAAEILNGGKIEHDLPPRQKTKPKLEPEPSPYDFIAFPQAALDDIFPGRKTPPIHHQSIDPRAYTPSLVHHYRNRQGQVVLIIIRYDSHDGGKRFVPVRYCARHGLTAIGWKPEEEHYFYNAAALATGKPILIVEGEKCVDVLSRLEPFDDLAIITWHGGTGRACKYPWSTLQGRRIFLWPDADQPSEKKPEGQGVACMQTIGEQVHPATVTLLQPLQEWIDRDCGYDAVDAVQQYGAAEARRLLDELSGPLFEPEEATPATPAAPGNIPYLVTARGGLERKEVTNWWTFITQDPRFGHELAFDILTKEVLVDDQPLASLTGGLNRIAHEIGQTAGFRGMRLKTIGEFITQAARRNPVNRLADELRGLVWDGQHRDLLRYAGADMQDPWARVAGKRWLLGLVRRILEPGCDHHLVLVLEGPQGIRKSTFFATLGQILGRDLYLDLSKLSQDKDIQLKLHGKVVIELSEMTAQRASESDALKGMISANKDTYRPPYAIEAEDFPRTCVFGGTTNARRYLKDTTGNRRYLTVPVSDRMEIEALRRDLPELLAEAVHSLSTGGQNWLTKDEEKMQESVSKLREVEWPQFAALDDILAGSPEISKSDLWIQLGFQAHSRSTTLADVLDKLMIEHGYQFGRWHRPDHHRQTWKRVEEL